MDAPTSTPTDDAERARRRRLRWLPAFIVADVIVAVIAVVSLVVVSADSADSADSPQHKQAAEPSRTSSTSPAAHLSAAESSIVAWAVAELPKSAVLLADAQLAQVLRGKGRTVLVPSDATGRTIQFVVSTPSLRSEARHYRAAADALTSSIPVVLAGTGGDSAGIRQVGAVSSAAMANDYRTRQASEVQLLANPAFSAAPKAAGLLRAGALDLRAATVLALVAATQRVQLVHVNVNAAESAAGRPARSIDVSATSTKKLQQATANLSPEYELASWEPRSDGTVRLVWPVDAQPVSQP